MIGLKKRASHFLIQSEIKRKLIVTPSNTFSRASHQRYYFRVLIGSSDFLCALWLARVFTLCLWHPSLGYWLFWMVFITWFMLRYNLTQFAIFCWCKNLKIRIMSIIFLRAEDLSFELGIVLSGSSRLHRHWILLTGDQLYCNF